MKPSSEAGTPLIIAKDDKNASLQIWRAMAAGRPVFHPKGMAYGEQVFWAGMAYFEAGSLASETPCLPPVGLPDAAKSRSNLRKLISV
jgi:hypothetical protein